MKTLISFKRRIESLIDLKGDTIITILAIVVIYKLYAAAELNMAHATIVGTMLGLRFGPEAVKKAKGTEE